MALSWLQKKVEQIVKKAGTNDPFEIARQRNIIIRYFPLGKTLGFYMKFCRLQVITINTETDESLRPFVCAHELGHAILHPNENTPFLLEHTFFSAQKREREANEFAVKLLLYGVDLRDYETIYQAMRVFGIPNGMESFLYREINF